MRLKSFFASTLEGALSMARQELGPDAMLVNSKRTGPEAKGLGEYEVICALEDPHTGPQIGAETSFPQFRAPSLDRLSTEVSELKRHMESMAATIARSAASMANLRSNPQLAACFAILTAAEVDSVLAHDLMAGLGDRVAGEADLRPVLSQELMKLLKTDPALGVPGRKPKVVAFVGPPGGGKTSALVRLATQYGLAARLPAQILSLDTYRVAASEQLRSYASILGIGFQIAETAGALAQALEEHRNKELIFIDTPGFGKHDIEEGRDIARFLSAHADIDVQLVLAASLKSADMKRIVALFEAFRPSKLMFTKLDETETFGSILNLAVHTGKPVSFLCYGQQIPEDLKPADSGQLAELILGRHFLDEGSKKVAAAA